LTGTRRGALALAALVWAGAARAAAAVPRALGSRPAADAMLAAEDRRYFVRFDRPVDHIRSRLIIRQGDRLVALLVPRLEAEPEVLFAEAPELPPGRYRLEWQVIALEGALIAEGGVDFTVMG
jgi:methionine-rich copper-binding protein CopC